MKQRYRVAVDTPVLEKEPGSEFEAEQTEHLSWLVSIGALELAGAKKSAEREQASDKGSSSK